MPNTTKQDLWNQVFPSLPLCALPEKIPENITSDGLTVFVKDNIRSIVDTWTYAVRFQGVNGRLAMHEDDSRDIDARRCAIISALLKAGAYK